MNMTKPAKIARDFLRDTEPFSHSATSPAQHATVAALLAVAAAIDRNTDALLEEDEEPADEYSIGVNDVEKLRDAVAKAQQRTTVRYGDRTLTGTKAGDEDVAMTSDTPFWTQPFVKPAMDASSTWTRPTVVADKDGDKPIESADTADIPQAAKVSPVTVTEGADVNTPPRITRDAEWGTNTRNVIIGTDEEDVLEFTGRAPGTYSTPEWIAVWPGREDRIRGLTVGEWVSTAGASHTGSAGVRALIASVKSRQKPTFATGGRIEGFTPNADTILDSVTDCGYRLTSEQVRNAGKGILDAINRGALKPSTDIETTAEQLNAQHLGRRITVHRSRCNNYADVSGELTEIEYTSSPDTIGHSIELDHGRRYAIEVTWPVTVHTDYPDIAIGNEA